MNLVRWTDAVYLDHPALGITYPAGRPTDSQSLSARRLATVEDFFDPAQFDALDPEGQNGRFGGTSHARTHRSEQTIR